MTIDRLQLSTARGLLAGRKVRDEADNRTNVYLLALANSGAGKDHPRKVNQKILFEVGLTDTLGNGFASGEGIEDRMLAQPASLFQVDELDGLLLKVTQSKDARHEQVVSVLLQMYSSAPSVYVMRATWACAFVEHQTRRMLHMAGSHTFESDFDAKRKRLLEILSKWRDQHGDRWMPFWKINRKLPWSRREHEEIRDTLLSQRLINHTMQQTGGRPGEMYRLVAPDSLTATSPN